MNNRICFLHVYVVPVFGCWFANRHAAMTIANPIPAAWGLTVTCLYLGIVANCACSPAEILLSPSKPDPKQHIDSGGEVVGGLLANRTVCFETKGHTSYANTRDFTLTAYVKVIQAKIEPVPGLGILGDFYIWWHGQLEPPEKITILGALIIRADLGSTAT